MRPNVFRSGTIWIYAPASMHNNNRCEDNKLKSDSSVASHLLQLHDLSYAQMIWSKEKERDTQKSDRRSVTNLKESERRTGNTVTVMFKAAFQSLLCSVQTKSGLD